MSQIVAVDASAVIAVLNRESDREQFFEVLVRGPAVIGWPTVFEVRIWSIRHLDESGSYWFAAWLDRDDIEIVPFDGELEAIAHGAYQRFGKGRHPAGLNFGDCMAYAVARRHGVPLLFKGGDFAKTDVEVHEASAPAG